ncbi:hypothetical protein XENORESO_005949 [Xenotaenia resolanae]|uniref:Uncharacterized protein n=1 Tax=Xenotaenia resolanae TaxID=208358 RepID=A0ABV0WY67_9TELE
MWLPGTISVNENPNRTPEEQHHLSFSGTAASDVGSEVQEAACLLVKQTVAPVTELPDCFHQSSHINIDLSWFPTINHGLFCSFPLVFHHCDHLTTCHLSQMNVHFISILK